jgi:predicted ATPase
MKIKVKNLGTIKEGTVELSKNLIIFTGQNNTGKSYMAYLIYGLYAIKINQANLMTKIFASKTITPTIKISDNKPLPNSIHFFPAERSAINMLAKEVYREKASKLDEISQKLLADDDLESVVKSIKQKGELVPRYPLAVSDYLFFINDLAYISKNESDFADFADEIETMLLQGKVSVSEYGDIKFTPGEAKQLDIHLCSSLVKSLSGLVLYFRHVAQKNDVIMMDEPELNLHPDSQRIVASILAKAVNRGFKLILSTHSDYIIKEFNNLIMLNKASETDLEEFGYDKKAVLDKDKISAYFFSDSTIEPIEVSDTGLSVKTIDATIDMLDNAMESIYYKLFER